MARARRGNGSYCNKDKKDTTYLHPCFLFNEKTTLFLPKICSRFSFFNFFLLLRQPFLLLLPTFLILALFHLCNFLILCFERGHSPQRVDTRSLREEGGVEMHSFKSSVTQAIALTSSDGYCHSQSPFYLRFSRKLAFFFWRLLFLHV